MENPNTLGDIYSMNPGAFLQAQGMLDRAAQGTDLTNATSAQNLDYNAQANPLRLQQMGLQNQASQAQLPGIQATSAMTQRKNSNEGLLNDAALADLKGKYSSQEIARHASDMENVGQIFRQGSATVFDSPLGAGAAVKDMLRKNGMEGMWNPDWDKYSAAQLAPILNDIGNRIGDAATKYRTLLGGINARGEIQKDVAQTAANSRIAVQQSRAAAMTALANARNSSDPKTLEAAYTMALLHSQKADDPTEKAQWQAQAQMLQKQYEAVLQLKGQASKIGTLDTGAVAKLPVRPAPTLPPITDTPAPQVPPPVAPQPNPATAQPTAQMKLWQPPAGRVRVFDPRTGKAGSVPEAQADEALKQGLVTF